MRRPVRLGTSNLASRHRPVFCLGTIAPCKRPQHPLDPNKLDMLSRALTRQRQLLTGLAARSLSSLPAEAAEEVRAGRADRGAATLLGRPLGLQGCPPDVCAIGSDAREAARLGGAHSSPRAAAAPKATTRRRSAACLPKGPCTGEQRAALLHGCSLLLMATSPYSVPSTTAGLRAPGLHPLCDRAPASHPYPHPVPAPCPPSAGLLHCGRHAPRLQPHARGAQPPVCARPGQHSRGCDPRHAGVLVGGRAGKHGRMASCEPSLAHPACCSC